MYRVYRFQIRTLLVLIPHLKHMILMNYNQCISLRWLVGKMTVLSCTKLMGKNIREQYGIQEISSKSQTSLFRPLRPSKVPSGSKLIVLSSPRSRQDHTHVIGVMGNFSYTRS